MRCCRTFIRIIVLPAIAFGGVPCDLAFTGGEIFAMDAARSSAQAVGITGKRISYECDAQ
jgi:hypothetical protein